MITMHSMLRCERCGKVKDPSDIVATLACGAKVCAPCLNRSIDVGLSLNRRARAERKCSK